MKPNIAEEHYYTSIIKNESYMIQVPLWLTDVPQTQSTSVEKFKESFNRFIKSCLKIQTKNVLESYYRRFNAIVELSIPETEKFHRRMILTQNIVDDTDEKIVEISNKTMLEGGISRYLKDTYPFTMTRIFNVSQFNTQGVMVIKIKSLNFKYLSDSIKKIFEAAPLVLITLVIDDRKNNLIYKRIFFMSYRKFIFIENPLLIFIRQHEITISKIIKENYGKHPPEFWKNGAWRIEEKSAGDFYGHSDNITLEHIEFQLQKFKAQPPFTIIEIAGGTGDLMSKVINRLVEQKYTIPIQYIMCDSDKGSCEIAEKARNGLFIQHRDFISKNPLQVEVIHTPLDQLPLKIQCTANLMISQGGPININIGYYQERMKHLLIMLSFIKLNGILLISGFTECMVNAKIFQKYGLKMLQSVAPGQSAGYFQYFIFKKIKEEKSPGEFPFSHPDHYPVASRITLRHTYKLYFLLLTLQSVAPLFFKNEKANHSIILCLVEYMNLDLTPEGSTKIVAECCSGKLNTPFFWSKEFKQLVEEVQINPTIKVEKEQVAKVGLALSV